MNALVSGFGAVFGLGMVLIAAGLRRRPARAGRQAIPPWRLPPPGRSTIILATGLGVLVVTRWPVLAVAAAAATWWFTDPARGQGSATERSEAIAAWAEMLRDATGTSRGIEGVLVATAQTAPPLIRESVVRFAHRLTYEPLEAALSDLADDLDDPIGDLIVAALTLAASSGGREIRAVLDNLSAAAHDDARMRRRLEVSRQRPRAEMHQVIAVIVCFTLLLIVFVRDYLRPYGTVGGQLVLALAATFWMGGFARMVRLGHIATVPRMLTRKDLS